MFWADIAAAPIVVPAVFFLWKYASITITADQSSTTVDLGIPFMLGFAIHRTIGILDFIKKNILPDPDLRSTAAKPAQSQGAASAGSAARVTVPSLVQSH